ncbi:hypothetical protein [Gordonia terrae]
MTTIPPAPPPRPQLPPETAQIQVPPDVLESIAPADPGWFTQPIATIVAALIALAAAYLAWKGVKRQIQANAENVTRQLSANSLALKQQLDAAERNLQRQLEAQAAEYEKNRLTDMRTAQRSHLIEVLTESAATAEELSGIATRFQLVREDPGLFDNPAEDRALAQHQFDTEYRIALRLIMQLQILGLDEVADGLEAVLNEAHSVVGEMDKYEQYAVSGGGWTIYEKRDSALASIRKALKIDRP